MQAHIKTRIYVHMWELKSAHQHKSRTSPSLLSFIVLQCHNYCICLSHCCLIYDVGLYFPALLMYYSSPLTLSVSAVHVFFYHPLIPVFILAIISHFVNPFHTLHTMFDASSIINARVSIHFFVLPSASSLIRDWTIMI